MKSLRESLFDTDLVGKKLAIDQFFDIHVTRYDYALKDNKRAEKEIEKQIGSINLKSLDCKGLVKILLDISKKYTKNWRGGGYTAKFHDKSGQRIDSNNLQSFNLLDISEIVMHCEDWNKDYVTFNTYYTLTRK